MNYSSVGFHPVEGERIVTCRRCGAQHGEGEFCKCATDAEREEWDALMRGERRSTAGVRIVSATVLTFQRRKRRMLCAIGLHKWGRWITTYTGPSIAIQRKECDGCGIAKQRLTS